jgi:hypothetical protein
LLLREPGSSVVSNVLKIKLIKIMNILRHKVNKEAKDLCTENYKTMQKEIERHKQMERHSLHVLGVEDNIVKCQYHPKQSIDST